jgi:hypothetical protein
MIAGFELGTSGSVASTFPSVGNKTVYGSLMRADVLHNDSKRMGIR